MIELQQYLKRRSISIRLYGAISHKIDFVILGTLQKAKAVPLHAMKALVGRRGGRL
jgi:hypothetical protein